MKNVWEEYSSPAMLYYQAGHAVNLKKRQKGLTANDPPMPKSNHFNSWWTNIYFLNENLLSTHPASDQMRVKSKLKSERC